MYQLIVFLKIILNFAKDKDFNSGKIEFQIFEPCNLIDLWQKSVENLGT